MKKPSTKLKKRLPGALVFTLVKDDGHKKVNHRPKVMSWRIIDMVFALMLRNDAMAFKGRCSTMPGQRRNNNS
jgi:hypothetical protein